jgi:hypothetical protein
LSNIIQVASAISQPYLESGVQELIELLQNITCKGFTLAFGKDSLLEGIFKHYKDYSVFKERKKN